MEKIIIERFFVEWKGIQKKLEILLSQSREETNKN